MIYKNYYTVDVLATVKDDELNVYVPFDYVNSYINLEEAISEAERLFKKDEVGRVLVNKWKRKYNEQGDYIGEDIVWDFTPISYEMEDE